MTRDQKLHKWGPGPWVDEPDRVEFYAHGLPCLMVRHAELGHWCGYAAVPPGHPLHGAHYDRAMDADVHAHGGLTYADQCKGDVCHVPKEGEPNDVWWFGFDLAHSGDLSPGLRVLLASVSETEARQSIARLRASERYRDEAYVRAECEALAKQLAERA